MAFRWGRGWGRRPVKYVASLSWPWLSSPTNDPKSALRLRMGRAEVPHPQKLYRGGEDASFGCERLKAIGIADGVGSWSSIGVNPGRFSRTLMRYVREELDELNGNGNLGDEAYNSEHAKPVKILRRAYDRTMATNLLGTSTALVAYVAHGVLHVANLGDSGLLVLRPLMVESISGMPKADGETTSVDTKEQSAAPRYKIVFRTAEQQHSFNCPFQLGSGRADPPEMAEVSETRLQNGDVLVAATDGVLDNLFDHDISLIVGSLADDPEELAYRIAWRAFEVASKAKGPDASPFAVNARKHGKKYDGGKMDDITVVVARVLDSSTVLPLRSAL